MQIWEKRSFAHGHHAKYAVDFAELPESFMFGLSRGG